jgi:hypothetical protein
MRENRITPSEAPVSETAPVISPEVAVFDARTEKQREVLKKLEEGTEAILTDEGFQAYLRMLGKFHNYSFANSLLIMVQNPEATKVNSYERWKSLNRQVKRGETGIKIFYPKKRWITEEDPDTGKERRREILTGYGIGNVFDIAQTEGEPLPEPPRVTESVETDDTATAINLKLSRFLIDEGLTLSSEDIHGHARGYWSPHQRKIAIRKSTVVSPFAISSTKTLIHEAAHAIADHRGNINRGDAEAVAEGGSWAVMFHYGQDTGSFSFPYLAGWVKDKNKLRNNLTEIQKVSNILITAIEGVSDPYADDFGSWENADPWAGVRDQLALEEDISHRYPNL